MSNKRRKQAAGFTIAEMLLALAISAMLLVAVAVAFNASIINYTKNEAIFKSVNNARQALVRMTSQMRTGDNFNTLDPNNRCSFFTAQNDDITYEYRSGEHKIFLITNSDGQAYELCDNVASMNFVKTATADGSDIKSIQISIKVGTGDNIRSVASGVLVRKNL